MHLMNYQYDSLVKLYFRSPLSPGLHKSAMEALRHTPRGLGRCGQFYAYRDSSCNGNDV